MGSSGHSLLEDSIQRVRSHRLRDQDVPQTKAGTAGSSAHLCFATDFCLFLPVCDSLSVSFTLIRTTIVQCLQKHPRPPGPLPTSLHHPSSRTGSQAFSVHGNTSSPSPSVQNQLFVRLICYDCYLSPLHTVHAFHPHNNPALGGILS